MNAKLYKLLTASKELNSHERALLAHYLLSSLETHADEDVEASWLKLAEERLREYEAGKIQPVDWQEIKSKLGN